MVYLSRTVRFAVNPPGLDRPGSNSFAGSPPLRRLAPFHEITVVCGGPIDQTSGYLINIKTIDEAVRETVVPRIATGVWASPDDRVASDPAMILADLAGLLSRSLPVDLRSLRWHVTPYQSFEMSTQDADHITFRSRFDFCASHRLYVDDWSEEKNREVFGKCSHPNGHGHNYEVEPSIVLPMEASLHAAAETIEEIVKDSVLDRFDHKHLNLDTQEFGPSGVNPSVEHIARICFQHLEAALKAELPEAKLRDITVWETPRTSATYPGR